MKEPSEADRARLRAHDAEYEARINKILDASLTDEVIHRDFERLWSSIKAPKEEKNKPFQIWLLQNLLTWPKVACAAGIATVILIVCLFHTNPHYHELGRVMALGPSQDTSSLSKLLPVLHAKPGIDIEHGALWMSVDFSKERVLFKLADSSVIEGKLILQSANSEGDLFVFTFSAQEPNQNGKAFTLTGEFSVRVRDPAQNPERIQWKNVVFGGVKLTSPAQAEFNYSKPRQ